MQCPECGSEWKASNRIDLIQRCPFCGASLEKEAPRPITFTNAKEGVRYIVDNFGSDVIVDNEQFTKLLNKFMPKLKQERKVIVEAMNEGVCTTLYDVTDQSEIDKCIAILQSIKILTQDACMAEKWACYAVETIVYALGWSVPMFGITPNIHMYQIPETVSHPWNQENPNEVWVQPNQVWVNPVESNGDAWDSQKQDVIEVSEEELNKPSEKNQIPVYDTHIFEQPSENDKSVEPQAEKSNEPVVESPVIEPPVEEAQEPVIEPVDDKTSVAEQVNEENHQNNAPQQPPFGQAPEHQYNNPWGMPPQQGAEGQQPPYNPWVYGPWGMPPQQGTDGQQPPYNPWGVSPQHNAHQSTEEANPKVEKEPEPPTVEKEAEPAVETTQEPEAPFIPQPESAAKKNDIDIDQYMDAPWAVHNRENNRETDVKPIDIPTNSTGTTDRTNGFSVSNEALQQDAPISSEQSAQTPAESHEPIHKVDFSSLNITPSDEPISKPSMENTPVVEIPQPEANASPAENSAAEDVAVNIPEPSAPETSSSTNEVFTKEDAKKFTLNHVQIPEGVIRIDNEAFKDNQKIEAVVLPTSLKEIGDSAFECCSKLLTINIPENVTDIGKCAFKGCSSITSIKLPDSITRINAECFAGCEKLKDFKIPSSVSHISRHSFMNCASIVDIEIPDGIHGLAENIFSGCKSLQTIKVPDSVSQIHKNCFSWCESLTTINLPEAITEIAPGSFTGCEKLKTLDIPSRVTKIGYGAFSKCTGLKSLTLPDTITEIEENAFLGCRALVVYCSSENAYIKRYCRLNRIRCKSST